MANDWKAWLELVEDPCCIKDRNRRKSTLTHISINCHGITFVSLLTINLINSELVESLYFIMDINRKKSTSTPYDNGITSICLYTLNLITRCEITHTLCGDCLGKATCFPPWRKSPCNTTIGINTVLVKMFVDSLVNPEHYKFAMFDETFCFLFVFSCTVVFWESFMFSSFVT